MAMFVGQIVTHFESKESGDQYLQGIYSVIGLIIACLLRAFLYNNYDMTTAHLSMKMRVATCNIIYKKVNN